MAKLHKLSDESLGLFDSIFNTKRFSTVLKFVFLGSTSQKQLIKITKLSEQYSFLMDADLLVIINEEYMETFDQESIAILIEQELDKICVNLDSGKIKMIKPDINTFSGIIAKWGIDKVSRANNVEDLFKQQKQDATETDFII